MLAQAGLTPEPLSFPSELDMIAFWKKAQENNQIHIANVFPLRPPENKIDHFFTNAKEGLKSLPPLRAGKYLKPELFHHVESLWQFLLDLKPNLILALGNTACWATLNEGKISDIRGTLKISPRLSIKVLPTYHPAAVLREWKLRPIVIADLAKAKEEAKNNTINRIERWMTVEPTLTEIENWLKLPADFYAVDIENPKYQLASGSFVYLRGQIAMIGFARSANDAMVIPFFDETKPNGNYWPTTNEELAARRLAQQALGSSVPKVFQNGVFDLTHLIRQNFRPSNIVGDTMLYHHALYPEMLKGLGFLGSVYSSEISWKRMSSKGNNLKRDE
jgi:uracil-DNA glycosylase